MYELNCIQSIKQLADCDVTSVGFWCLTGEVGCQLEQHTNVGEGVMGTLAFKLLMTDERFNDMPVILDTPGSDLIKQIKHLYKFCD